MAAAIDLEVPPDAGGTRLDGYLGAEPSIGSRAAAARLIDDGLVTVDGEPARKSRVLKGGERILVARAAATPADRASADAVAAFSVIYEDDDLMVIDKSAGLVVHPAPGNRSGTLSQALAGRSGGGDAERPGIVHRLDKDTSGMLVVAKNDATLRALQAAMKKRAVKREYLALVRGTPRSRTGTIDAPLGRDRRSPEQVVVRADSPRPAVTHFAVEERLGPRTLLRVTLETGRTHQIRAHLAAIDLPVCGDESYGVAADLGLTRQFLHAATLAFEHPAGDRPLRFESPLPPDLAAALAAARAER